MSYREDRRGDRRAGQPIMSRLAPACLMLKDQVVRGDAAVVR